MTDPVLHEDDSIALEATLPRDLSGATVEFLVGTEERPVSTVIDNPTAGEVAVPLATADFDPGVTEVKFRITFGDGTVEVLPPEGDSVFVYD
jgi:hypothetical protein